MEKLVNDKAHDSAADHEEHNYVHAGDPQKDMQQSEEHKDEILANEEVSTTREMRDDGNKSADHQSEEISLLHEKHAVNNTDAGMIHVNNDNMDTHVNVALGNEDARTSQVHAGMPSTQEKQEHNVKHAPGKLAACEKQEHNVELAPLTHDPPENTSCRVSTSHNGHADTINESIEDQMPHENVSHDHDVLAATHEHKEKSSTHDNATHDNEHDGFGQEHGRRHKTHEKATDDGHVGVTCESGEAQMTHEKHACNAQNAEGLTHEKLARISTDMDSTLQAKHMHDEEAGHTPGDKSLKHGDDAGVAHELGHTQRYEVVHAEPSHGHGEKRGSEDECETKKAFLDENLSKERVHFSRGSTPDVDTPTQQTSSPFSYTKSSKPGSKGAGNPERGPGSTDGIPETPSTSWAFSARASIAPSKFDHMATLRFTYGAYRESNRGKEGVPLSLLPEILESARFMVPPPRDLVPLLQRIDIDYKVGDLVRWSLLQNLALQIERKEARYPAVFIPRPSVARPNSNSPNSWKVLQRSPTRRTHPEDDCPELEPQVYEMMREIDNHRRKSAKEGNYLAADAAAQRLTELKLWDERLKNFQKEVVDHAQRLKQQHIAALHHFKEKMVSKTPAKAQWSRELLKQRRIQVYLGKQGKYLEAQEVKQSADRMEQAELQAAIAAFQAELIGKEQTVRVKQQTEMDILLQRAARTREEIRKSRTLDLQRCHQRHKNVMRELAAIQKQEVFRFDQLMQKKVQNPYTGVVGLGGQRAVQSPARARINAADYSTDDALYSGGEDGSMRD